MKAHLFNTKSSSVSIYQKSDNYMFAFLVLEILLKERDIDSRIGLDVFEDRMQSKWGMGNEGVVFKRR